MKKNFLVIGNPIDHSLSPKLHNYWIKKYKINASYEKKLLDNREIEDLIFNVRKEKIHGLNVTVPFKKVIIPFLDELSEEAEISQSVNTIYKRDNKIIGDNTDIEGFKLSLEKTEQEIKNKKALILGAGGVVPSIIIALKKMQIKKIYLSNRTELKAKELKENFPEIELIKWGETLDFDIIINATSIGLKEEDEININYQQISKDKFFYDVIYNPAETNFLKNAKKYGGITKNGKMMFIYQAQKAFFIWHKIVPEVDNETINLLDV
ncbi:shikimate dehydrogenase [Candidatus Pelagibacter bacterium]|nr:shikimate dehydrogenase [Candidatus Pelagibacter bacterium]MDA8801632.1 shikimate dehydrogenase [Candidatus Pelagibacter bacterium]